MGLTVNFQIYHPDPFASPEEIEALMERLRYQISGWGIASLPIITLSYPLTDYRNCSDESLRWFLIQAQWYPNPKKRSSRYLAPLIPKQLIGFTVVPDPPFYGSEPLNFALATYPKLKGWRWKAFCKTQYASNFGIENFLRAHLTVIAVLDLAKQEGLRVKVYDEGGFWESRDVDRLLKVLGEYNAITAAFMELLHSAAPEGLEAPILHHPEFRLYAMLGREKVKNLQGLVDVLKTLSSLPYPSKPKPSF